MHLFALDPWWSDFYAVGGFVVGILSLVVSIAGFWIAITQIRETKRAAEAAQEAAKQTLAESKEAYERFVGSYASRLIADLQRAVNADDWKLADLRAHDLADLLATLPRLRRGLAAAVASLRAAGQAFAEKAAGRNPKFSRAKWVELLHELQARLDDLRSPFREATDGEADPNNPAREVPDDRPRPSGQNPGGTGELGQGGDG